MSDGSHKCSDEHVSLTYASHRPCAICGKTPWSTDTYAIVINGVVYCGRCHTNARNLIPNTLHLQQPNSLQ